MTSQLPLLDGIYECRRSYKGERYAGPFGSPEEARRQTGATGNVIVRRTAIDSVVVYKWTKHGWENAVGGGP